MPRKKSKKSYPADTLTGTILAEMFAVSGQTIRGYGASNQIKRIGHGKYAGKDALKFFIEKDIAGMLGANYSGNEDSDDIVVAKLRYEKAKAELEENLVKVIQRKLILRTDILGYVTEILAQFKRELLALHQILPAEIFGMVGDECADYIEKHIEKLYHQVIEKADINTFLEATEEDE